MRDSDFNERARATDQSGKKVIVISSAEVVEDFGWPAVFEAASRKYDLGDFTVAADIPQVRVLSSDVNA
ncbi:MAG: hypothetical protein CGW95_12930 [Phenylobacterium zucineum]|nr:MAG: hypothetical protein CGW95_12930 [Phenylobacterium zucineum]